MSLKRSVLGLMVLSGCAGADGLESTADEAKGDEFATASAELTCDLGLTAALGSACTASAAPTAITAAALSSASPPQIEADTRAYGVRFVGGTAKEAALRFVPTQTTEYNVYLGTPNVPFRIIGPSGEVVSSCASAVTNTECTTLRKAATYTLVAGQSYRLEFGPSTSVSYVRLYLQTRVTPTLACDADDLTTLAAACVAAPSAIKLAAALPAAPSAPSVALDDTYVLTLGTVGTNTYAGAFSFTPPATDDYELFLGTPKIPLAVQAGSAPVQAACTRGVPASECSLLRRGDKFHLTGGVTYRFTLGPNVNTANVRVALRRAIGPDECALGTDDCDDDPNACVNQPFGFTCSCPPGYVGTGVGADGCALPPVVINEVESSGGAPGDWVELYNSGATQADVSGFRFIDNDPTHTFYTIPAGTVIPAGGFLVLDEAQFGFGLGGADSAQLYPPTGSTPAASYSWTAHAANTYGRCPDGTGELQNTTVVTKGAANDCTVVPPPPPPVGDPAPVVINEVESSGGAPGDWVEIYNTGSQAADISGYQFKDNDDTHAFYTLPAGSVIPAGGFLVIEEAQFGFGLGAADSARLYQAGASAPFASYSWTTHAATSYGRCPDGTGALAVTGSVTKGAANDCGAVPPPDPGTGTFTVWPGATMVSEVDVAGTFASNLSGVTYQPASVEGQPVLWAVQNGPSTLYRLVFDGSAWVSASTNTWSVGKLLHYPNGSGQPDSEGVTKAEWDLPYVYVATERDNAQNTVSRLSILRFDVSGIDAELSATHEWNLNTDIPATGPNTGLEAISWLPDSVLVARGFFDERAGASYDPALYPDHGTGLFAVGVEATGTLYVYALNHADGSALRVATILSTQPGVMGLELDRDTGALFSYCDDTCGNRTVALAIDQTAGSSTLGRFVRKAAYERPAGLPNVNNEGFAVAPEAECSAGLKPVFWTDDSSTGGHALRAGALSCGLTF